MVAALIACAFVAASASATSNMVAWGSGGFGQLGNGEGAGNTDAPEAVHGISGVVAISAGGEHSLALLSNGTVMSWGDNFSGQVGNGGYSDVYVPVQVSGLSNVVAISAGGEFSLALLSNGTVMAWGNDSQGQLGNGSTSSSGVPVPVTGLSGVTAISAGGYHSLALLSNGTVESWGENYSGELGNGTETASDVPVPVSGLSGVTAIAAGGYHSLALLSNGTVDAWGYNSYGQLGIGHSEQYNEHNDVPAPVKNVSGASAIAAGALDSMALMSGGTAMAWGDDRSGQLGDGSHFTNSNLPVTVRGLTGAVALAAGFEFSLALLSNHTVMAWGAGELLGSGTTAPSSYVPEPISVCELSEVAGVSAGEYHSLAYGVPGPPCPGITSITPRIGRVRGGTSVTITGTNLSGATAVKFGANNATSFTVNSETSITAIAPAGTGVADVRVSTAHGTSPEHGADQLTYKAGPVITKLTPNVGLTSGGTVVTITGANFTGTTAVAFGANSATSFTVNSESTITAVAPAGSSTVDVTVTSPEGTSAIVTADHFTYAAGSPPEFGRCIHAVGEKSGERTFYHGSYTDSSCEKINAEKAGKYEWYPGLAGGTCEAVAVEKVGKEKIYHGAYSNSDCTATSTERLGKYEWYPEVSSLTHFVSSGSTITFVTAGGTRITCATEAGSGEYAGTKQVANVVLDFSNCEGPGGKCQSPGASTGEIVTRVLAGELGWEDKEKQKVAFDLYRTGREGLLFEVTCGITRLSVKGSVIAPVKTGVMAPKSTLKYAESKGKQAIEHFEGEPNDVLETSIEGGAFEQTVLSFTETQTSEEDVAVNATV
jgi:alpha-tubulin suppressor-like RCC1 family protein